MRASNAHMVYDVIIIGAGAAGLMSAAIASEQGKKVLLLERNAKAGLKILISGGGRCNFTNKYADPKDYVSNNHHFCKSALKQFTQDDFIDWVKAAKIDYYEKTLGQLFCKQSSKEITQLLLSKINTQHVEILYQQNISSFEKNHELFIIHANQQHYQSKNLIVATGGLSFPKLGASDLGYKIAKHFGHKVTILSPALDGFVFDQAEHRIFSKLSGISLLAQLSVNKKNFQENILFTHKGISGPAALKGSLYWYKNDSISLDFLPELDFTKWRKEKQSTQSSKNILTLLSEVLPARLAETILDFCEVKNKKIAELSKKDFERLEKNLKHFSFTPKSTVGYSKAEVTRGGVDTKHLSSKTMESKLIPGLYFVGEVLDITGLLGGYNFQWAWSSGWVAGTNLQ